MSILVWIVHNLKYNHFFYHKLKTYVFTGVEEWEMGFENIIFIL